MTTSDDEKELLPEPRRKRSKPNMEELAETAWELYTTYLVSKKLPVRVPNGDVSQLVKILDLTEPYIHPNTVKQVYQLITKEDLLPVLVSVASFLLAEEAISFFFRTAPDSDNCLKDIEKYTSKSLAFFAHNAAAWIMGANFARLTARLSAQQVTGWYENAADCAIHVQAAGLVLMEDETIDDDVKEWVELLLLNACVGVERLVSERRKPHSDTEKCNGNEEADEFSPSSVEAAARLIGAILPSILGDHTTALVALKRFPLTHLLHPNMLNKDSSSTAQVTNVASEPATYRREQGLLPSALYTRLCQVFSSESPYWKDNEHADGGYYSFWMDLPKEDEPPSNLIDDVVCNYLLPLAKRHLDAERAQKICGYEWRVNIRATGDGWGNNLHFEHAHLLKDEKNEDRYPTLSSILYLTCAEEKSGNTIVIDQTSGSTDKAEYGWSSPAEDNSLLVFPGNLMSATLPGNNANTSSAAPDEADSSIPVAMVTTLTKSQLLRVADLWTLCAESKPVPDNLTVMVGFWTQRVPDALPTPPPQVYYSPCGPLPPDSSRWVQALKDGYHVNGGVASPSSMAAKKVDDHPVTITRMLRLGPAWGEVDTAEKHVALADGSPVASSAVRIPRQFTNSFFLQAKTDDGIPEALPEEE